MSLAEHLRPHPVGSTHPGSRAPAESPGERDSPVRAALLQAAFQRLRPALLMTVTVCLVFVGLLWPFFPPRGMMLWALVLLGVAGLRFGSALLFARAGRHAGELARWEGWFAAGALAGGASWAFGPLLLMPGAEGPQRYLLVLTLLAVSAVSMSSLASQLGAMFAFQVAALGPTAAVLWVTSRSDVQTLAAAIVFAALLSLMIVGRASSRSTRSLVAAEWHLSSAVVDARAASSAKTRFLANMSHELRTPLNAVIGAAQLLKVSDDSPAQRAELVQAIQRSGTNLLGLIDNILDLSRVEAGELRLAVDDFHLPDCVDAAMVTAGLAARAQGLVLAAVVAPDLAAWRRGDADRLRQLLLNLLGNAIKFTPLGEVVLRVQAGASDGEVCFSVTDTGVGIDPLALPHVFEAFRQADETTHRRFGGSGLGLAIVRQIVGAMGGRIDVRSQPGQGSCFDMALPLPGVQGPAVAEAPLQRPVAFFEPHEPSAEALSAQLQRLGCNAHRVHDAASLQAWCARASVDLPAWLLLADGTAQGQDLLRQGRIHARGATLVRMTEADAADPAAAAPAVQRGLRKPVTRAALVSCLAVPASAAVVPPAAPPPLPAGDGATASSATEVLVVEDDALNQTIVCRLLRHAGYRVSAVSDGPAALECLRSRSFDIVLMDWQMPGMDGLETTRRLRAGQAGEGARQVPVVALTANAFGEDRAACLAAGMNDFLTKPVVLGALTAAIDRLVPRRPPAVDAQPTQAALEGRP